MPTPIPDMEPDPLPRPRFFRRKRWERHEAYRLEVIARNERLRQAQRIDKWAK